MSATYPRCNACGRQLAGYDLWLYRHARTVSRDVKKCGRCNASDERMVKMKGNAGPGNSTSGRKDTST